MQDAGTVEYEFPDRQGNYLRVARAGEVLVVNSWNLVAVGYQSDEERELAAGIAARLAHNRKDSP